MTRVGDSTSQATYRRVRQTGRDLHHAPTGHAILLRARDLPRGSSRVRHNLSRICHMMRRVRFIASLGMRAAGRHNPQCDDELRDCSAEQCPSAKGHGACAAEYVSDLIEAVLAVARAHGAERKRESECVSW